MVNKRDIDIAKEKINIFSYIKESTRIEPRKSGKLWRFCPCPKCGSKNLDKSRSSLLVEWLRIVRVNKPNFGIYEDVKNITCGKHRQTFDLFIKELQEYGYNTYWKVLKASNYGLPQERERVYVVIIKKEIDNELFSNYLS